MMDYSFSLLNLEFNISFPFAQFSEYAFGKTTLIGIAVVYIIACYRFSNITLSKSLELYFIMISCMPIGLVQIILLKRKIIHFMFILSCSNNARYRHTCFEHFKFVRVFHH